MDAQFGLRDFEAGRSRNGDVGTINAPALDDVFHRLQYSDLPHIVLDCGMALYRPLQCYMEECDLPRTLLEHRIHTWFHLPVCGGESQGHHGRTRHPGRNGLVRPRRRVERDRVAERVPGPVRAGWIPGQGERLGIQHLKAWKLLGPLVDNRVITLGTPSPASKKDIDQWVTIRGSSFQSAMRDIGTPALSRHPPLPGLEPIRGPATGHFSPLGALFGRPRPDQVACRTGGVPGG